MKLYASMSVASPSSARASWSGRIVRRRRLRGSARTSPGRRAPGGPRFGSPRASRSGRSHRPPPARRACRSSPPRTPRPPPPPSAMLRCCVSRRSRSQPRRRGRRGRPWRRSSRHRRAPGAGRDPRAGWRSPGRSARVLEDGGRRGPIRDHRRGPAPPRPRWLRGITGQRWQRVKPSRSRVRHHPMHVERRLPLSDARRTPAMKSGCTARNDAMQPGRGRVRLVPDLADEDVPSSVELR